MTTEEQNHELEFYGGDIDLFAREIIVAAWHAEMPLEKVMSDLENWPELATVVKKHWNLIYGNK